MADYITTLLDDNEVDTLSPTTTFPALRDANGNYLDNTLAASDLNAAKNGKILDLVNNKVNKSDIADNLTTNDSTKVLSAKQGKILNDSINAIIDVIQVGEVTFSEVGLSSNAYIDIDSYITNRNNIQAIVPYIWGTGFATFLVVASVGRYSSKYYLNYVNHYNASVKGNLNLVVIYK